MNKKSKISATMVMCIFGIFMTTTAYLGEKNQQVSTNVEIQENNYYLSAGFSRAMSTILEDAENETLTMEENERLNMKDSYYDEEVESEPEMKYEEIPVNKVAYVYTDLLNLRSNANTDSEVLTVLNYGTELQVIGEMNMYMNEELIDQWVHVNYQGYTGYLKSDYLIDEEPYYSLGTYDITYYCPCAICCDVETGITASGAIATAGVTCAADASIPFGTELIIDGHTYIVQDRGGAINGNHIDIFCNTHEEALSRVRHNAEVYVKNDID